MSRSCGHGWTFWREGVRSIRKILRLGSEGIVCHSLLLHQRLLLLQQLLFQCVIACLLLLLHSSNWRRCEFCLKRRKQPTDERLGHGFCRFGIGVKWRPKDAGDEFVKLLARRRQSLKVILCATLRLRSRG